MSKTRAFFIGVCSLSLLLIALSGVFLLFIVDRIEARAQNHALSIEPEAFSHSKEIKKRVYCPGSEVLVDFSRPDIKGYRRISNMLLTPKPLNLGNGDVIEWPNCKVFYRTFNIFDLGFWVRTIQGGVFNRTLFRRINDDATEKGVITFRLPPIDEMAGRTVEFDMSATFVLPGKGTETREKKIVLKDLFVTVSPVDVYKEMKAIRIANLKKKYVAGYIFLIACIGFISSLAVLLGVVRGIRRRTGATHPPHQPA